MQRDFSILNELLDTLHITDVIFNNNDLSVSPIEQSILFGTSGNISVLWNPSAGEDLNDSLQIFSNDLIIGTIYLFGESTTSSPIISITNDGLDFWGQTVGDTTTRILTISNISTLAALYVDSITCDLTEFFTDDSSYYLLPNSSINIPVYFNSSASGGYESELIIHSNDQNNHLEGVSVFGLGIYEEPYIHVDMDTIIFSSIVANMEESLTATFNVYNWGATDLVIEDIFVTAPFSATPSSGNIPGVGTGTGDNGNLYRLEITVELSSFEEIERTLFIYSNASNNSELPISLFYELSEDINFSLGSSLPMSLDGGASSGTAMIDMNDDNLLDFVVANRGEEFDPEFASPDRYYLQNSDGTFTQHEIDIYNDSEGVTISDHNRDGNIEFLFYGGINHFVYYEHNEFWGGDGDMYESYVMGGYFTLNSSSYDFDLDGDLDYINVGSNNYNGATFLFNQIQNLDDDDMETDFFWWFEQFMNFGEVNTLNGFELNGDEIGVGYSVSCLDINNDDKGDIFLANLDHNNQLFFNITQNEEDNDIEFLSIDNLQITTQDDGTIGASWADYDNDGDMDVVIVRHLDNMSSLYNNAEGLFLPVFEFPSSMGSSWGDLNNDGLIDLVTTNQTDYDSYLHINLGDNSFESKILPSGDHRGVSIGDMDNDGDLDIYIANRSGQNNTVLINEGNDNNWINIRCIDNIGNRLSIGTKVKVKASINSIPTWQYQEIMSQTGAGFGGLNSLNVEFGLGNATLIDSIIVHWSLGQKDTMTNIDVNQFLTLYNEEQSLAVDNISIPSEFRLNNNYPNPFNPITNISYDIPMAIDVKIEIFNIMGQSVKILANTFHQPGVHKIQWDASNDAGQPVSAGMYIFTIRAGEFRQTRKMVLLK